LYAPLHQGTKKEALKGRNPAPQRRYGRVEDCVSQTSTGLHENRSQLGGEVPGGGVSGETGMRWENGSPALLLSQGGKRASRHKINVVQGAKRDFGLGKGVSVQSVFFRKGKSRRGQGANI